MHVAAVVQPAVGLTPLLASIILILPAFPCRAPFGLLPRFHVLPFGAFLALRGRRGGLLTLLARRRLCPLLAFGTFNPRSLGASFRLTHRARLVLALPLLLVLLLPLLIPLPLLLLFGAGGLLRVGLTPLPLRVAAGCTLALPARRPVFACALFRRRRG